MRLVLACTLLLLVGLIQTVSADEVIFKNGDRLSGTITQGAGGKVTIKTEAAGDVTPARLVTGLITERGVCAAKESELVALFPEMAHG